MKAKEEELRNAMSKTQELLNKVKDMEEKVATLSQEKNDLKIQLQAVRGALGEGEELGALATVQTSRVAMSQALDGRMSFLRVMCLRPSLFFIVMSPLTQIPKCLYQSLICPQHTQKGWPCEACPDKMWWEKPPK